MINIAVESHGSLVLTGHHDNGATSEIRVHALPGTLEIVADFAQSTAEVSIDGEHTPLEADR